MIVRQHGAQNGSGGHTQGAPPPRAGKGAASGSSGPFSAVESKSLTGSVKATGYDKKNGGLEPSLHPSAGRQRFRLGLSRHHESR